MTGSELGFWVQILVTYRTDDIRCVESNMLHSCTSIVVYILLKYIQKCKLIIMLLWILEIGVKCADIQQHKTVLKR